MATEDDPSVILLRSADGPDDRYIRAFADRGMRAACVPVLAFQFPHQEALQARLATPDEYAGLIVTSPRAVQALRDVSVAPSTRGAWTRKPAYAVGPKTASALHAWGMSPEGQEAGNAAALATVIAKEKKPYLFVCGNRRRETLPTALREADIPFEELVVYETVLRPELEIPPAEANDWLAFFSPSGVEAVARYAADTAAGYRYAAIGVTTAQAVRDHGWRVEAVADTPSPDALADAVSSASSER